jgi:anthranilate synthase component I
MKKINIRTVNKKLLADVYTPVGIYLRLRDRFRDTILLESTDHHAADNSYSFIGVHAIAGIEVKNPEVAEWKDLIEFKLPGQDPKKKGINNPKEVLAVLQDFMDGFECEFSNEKQTKFAQGLFGYTNYDAVQFFEDIDIAKNSTAVADSNAISLMRYRLYQYVIAFDHFKDELYICENIIQGIESQLELVESLICGKDIPVYPFQVKGEESSNLTDDEYKAIVEEGIRSCYRGDVFQVVLSRRFQQEFTGDEFNVYRSLRSINPSPYLFFLDYGDYKLMGSSPEAQLIVENGKAVLHPIAGTFKRTGDEELDKKESERLRDDPKENAEHVMLIDLARNDLSRNCTEVEIVHNRQIQYYSHVIHLVSEVSGKVQEGKTAFELLASTFPAGTLSGAPKYKAMQLINACEPTARSYYGGCLGFVGFDGSFNHAIMIRTFLSRNNTLTYQAGAGVVASSNPESELQEVNNKLLALKSAILQAPKIL